MANNKKAVGSKKGVVFNIQRFSVHDGPGIRDLLFLKGCPLRCKWCSNPESQHEYPELGYNRNRCIGVVECGLCKEVCHVGAIKEARDGKVRVNRALCNNCGKCVEVCPAQALTLFGECLSSQDVLKIVEEDLAFYSRSGGGITLSGGEPLLQTEFVENLLRECQERGLDTAIETSGYGSWERLETISRQADLVFYDIKCMESKKHKKFTGVANKLILENLRKLARRFPQKPIIVRTPVVPGINAEEGDICAIAKFLREIESLQEYELLPYHAFGESKYDQLGRRYPLRGQKPPTEEQMAALKALKDAILGEA